MDGHLIAGYNVAFVRLAPPVQAFPEYKSVEDLVNAEALANTQDIMLAVGLHQTYFQHAFDTLNITNANGRSLHDINALANNHANKMLTAQEQAVLGGAANNSASALTDFVAKVKGQAVELVMCQQVKALKLNNIKSYFLGCNVQVGSVSYIIKFLKKASGVYGSLVANNAVRTVAVNNPFVKYHIAYASGGQLISKVIAALGAIADQFFTQLERDAADASNTAIWDIGLNNAIPDRAFVVTYGFLKTYAMLPDNWYQGSKKWDEAPLNVRNDVMRVFKRYKELEGAAGGVEAAVDMNALIAAMPASVRAADHP